MKRWLLLTWIVAATLPACTRSRSDSSAAEQASGPPGVRLVIAYGSEKKTWLEEQAKAFTASGAKLRSGQPIRIEARALGSGEAVQGLLSGALQPHVFSPASGAYITLLNQRW